MPCTFPLIVLATVPAPLGPSIPVEAVYCHLIPSYFTSAQRRSSLTVTDTQTDRQIDRQWPVAAQHMHSLDAPYGETEGAWHPSRLSLPSTQSFWGPPGLHSHNIYLGREDPQGSMDYPRVLRGLGREGKAGISPGRRESRLGLWAGGSETQRGGPRGA